MTGMVSIWCGSIQGAGGMKFDGFLKKQVLLEIFSEKKLSRYYTQVLGIFDDLIPGHNSSRQLVGKWF